MRRFIAAIAVLLAGTSLMVVAQTTTTPTLLDTAESGDHAAAIAMLDSVTETWADDNIAFTAPLLRTFAQRRARIDHARRGAQSVADR